MGDKQVGDLDDQMVEYLVLSMVVKLDLDKAEVMVNLMAGQKALKLALRQVVLMADSMETIQAAAMAVMMG